MGLRYSRELQVNDDVSVRRRQQQPNKKSKRAAVSSDTDGKQLATGKKKRRLEKGRVHKEEEEEEESTVKKETEIEDDLHQDTDEDSRKPPDVVKEEEDVTEDGEGILQLDIDEREDSKQPPAVFMDEEGYWYETEENDNGEDVLLRGNDEWEDSKKPSAAIKEETEEKEDGEEILQLDRDEPEDSKKPPAAVKKEVENEVGHEYSPGEIDEKSREENDDQATYLPDEITSTKGLLPSACPTSVETASSPAMTVVTKPKSAKQHVSHAATPVPIVQVSSALALIPADEKPAAAGRGNVCSEDKTSPEGAEQRGSCREEDKSTKISGYAIRSRSNATIVKRKYSLWSLSHENNKKGARSKSLRKEKESSTSLGEANRSPMASTDEDAFGRGICNPLDEASDTSDSVGGIVDQDDAILGVHDVKWIRMYERLRAFKDSHGDCELFRCQPL
jgi:hypothetical protein